MYKMILCSKDNDFIIDGLLILKLRIKDLWNHTGYYTLEEEYPFVEISM